MARDQPINLVIRRPAPYSSDDALVSASEVASWAFCPEAWRLEYGLHLEPVNALERAAGERHHAGKARSERSAGGLIVVGRFLVALAALLGAYLVFRAW